MAVAISSVVTPRSSDYAVERRYPTLIDPPASQYAEITQSRPEYLTPTQFGDLDTVVVRITDASMAHHYSTWQAFNADQSMVLLWGSGGTILNTSDWSSVRSGFDPGFVACFWDPVDSDIIWGHDGFGGGNGIYRYSVSANNSTRYPVPPASGGAYNGISIGGGEGSISADGKYLVLIGTKAGSSDRFVIVWDAENNQVYGTLTLSGWGSDLDNAMISPSGNWIVLASLRAGERGHRIYDRATLTFQRAYTGGSGTNSNNGFTGHMDIGYRTDGSECMVRQRNDGGLVSVRLSDGNERLEIPGSSFSWGNHISCRNIHRPGYAYVSMSYQSDQTTKPLYREIFSVKLDGSGQIERWGQAMFPNSGDYALQAKATASPYGDMVLFTSGWGTTTPREYVLEVPEEMPEPPPVDPEWLAFFDFTDTANLYQDRAGTTPVTTVGQRIGRVNDPVSGLAMSEVDGSGVRFTLRSDGARLYAEADGYQYLEDGNHGAWFDTRMNGRDPWWFCVAVRLETLGDVATLVTKQHGSSPYSGAEIAFFSSGGQTRLRLRRQGSGFDLSATINDASIAQSQIVVVSGGYDGNNSTIRINLGTKVMQADANSLPNSSVYNSAWIGSGGAGTSKVRYYEVGFMDHYPSSEEEEAAIRQAGVLAGLSL